MEAINCCDLDEYRNQGRVDYCEKLLYDFPIDPSSPEKRKILKEEARNNCLLINCFKITWRRTIGSQYKLDK